MQVACPTHQSQERFSERIILSSIADELAISICIAKIAYLVNEGKRLEALQPHSGRSPLVQLNTKVLTFA